MLFTHLNLFILFIGRPVFYLRIQHAIYIYFYFWFVFLLSVSFCHEMEVWRIHNVAQCFSFIPVVNCSTPVKHFNPTEPFTVFNALLERGDFRKDTCCFPECGPGPNNPARRRHEQSIIASVPVVS